MSAADRALPYYTWFWRDHRANRRAQRLSLAAEGALRRLFDECWAEGMIPSDPPAVAEILGCSSAEVREVWPAIESFFEAADVDGFLVNRKLEGMRTKMDRERADKVRAGRMGAKAKYTPQFDLLAGASHVPKQSKEEREKRTTLNPMRVDLRASSASITSAWNAMASQIGAARIVALKGKRLITLHARLREKGWLDRALAAIAYLGSDSWYSTNPDAVRFDVLLRAGKAEEYVERSSVKRSPNGAHSRGDARRDVDDSAAKLLHENPEAGRRHVTDGHEDVFSMQH